MAVVSSNYLFERNTTRTWATYPDFWHFSLEKRGKKFDQKLPDPGSNPGRPLVRDRGRRQGHQSPIPWAIFCLKKQWKSFPRPSGSRKTLKNRPRGDLVSVPRPPLSPAEFAMSFISAAGRNRVPMTRTRPHLNGVHGRIFKKKRF